MSGKTGKKETQGITIKKDEDFSEWYNEVILKAGLADFAPIGGCMTIRPYGYAIWENIQKKFDGMIKDKGHKNAYFPLFIPESFLQKESEHFEGFVPEVAWVEADEGKYAIRPTSETIIYDAYSKWIRSWRDLPMLLNQWCNVVRWETKVTKLFMRTREFLWQEGHTAHATDKEAHDEMMMILGMYVDLIKNSLAIPVIEGEKSATERFAGAKITTTMESLMPDGKALQMGTSHHLGQHFSKAFGIKFLDKDGKEKHVHQTSWGITTRLIGAIVSVHGDDKGLVLPPKIAPIQVVIVPIIFDKNKKETLAECRKVKETLEKSGLSVELDERDSYSAGWKFNEWEMKGVPLRLEIGPRDIDNKQAVFVRRDTGKKDTVKLKDLEKNAKKALEEIQNKLLSNAKKHLTDNTVSAKTYEELKSAIEKKKMVRASWCENAACEEKIKDETAATIRVIPFKEKEKPGKCIACGKKAKHVVYLSRAY